MSIAKNRRKRTEQTGTHPSRGVNPVGILLFLTRHFKPRTATPRRILKLRPVGCRVGQGRLPAAGPPYCVRFAKKSCKRLAGLREAELFRL
jgi:hypothetical protein